MGINNFTFYFSHGDSGELRVMAVVDLFASCGTCGYREVQRFYRGVPFHTLTLPRFSKVVSGASRWASYACSNCGAAVTGSNVERSCVTYGFADGRGQVRGHAEGATLTGFELRQRGLDVQELPPEPDEAELLDELDDDEIFDVCGRVFNPKAAWRELLEDAGREPTAAVGEDVAGGLWIGVGPGRSDVEALYSETPEGRDKLDGGRVMAVELLQRAPTTAPFSDAAVGGAPSQWLQAWATAALESGTLAALAYINIVWATRRLTDTLDNGRLTWTREEGEDGPIITDIATPQGDAYPSAVAVADIARFAVATGATPQESARYIGELIIAHMLQLDL